jgi:hypothetical protein
MRLSSLGLAILWAAGCQAPSEERPQPTTDIITKDDLGNDVEVVRTALLGQVPSYWCSTKDANGCTGTGPEPSVNVCWVNPSNATISGTGYTVTEPELRAIARQAVERNWQRHAKVNFTNWSTCVSGEDVRITINQTGGPSANGVGRPASGARLVNLNLYFNDIPARCKSNRGQHDRCVMSDAIHEFGHVLGFWHEESRNDYTGASCGNGDPKQPVQYYGTYTTQSIMSYCSDGINGTRAFTEVMPNDIAAVQRAYGRKRPGEVVSINGDCLSHDGSNGSRTMIFECNDLNRGWQRFNWNNPTQPWKTLNTTTSLVARCLDLDGNNQNNGARIQAWDCLGNQNQTWAFENISIRGWGGLCLTLPGGNTANGTEIQVQSCGNTGQLWSLASDGTVRFGSLSGTKCLTAGFFSLNRYFIWNCDGATDQRIVFEGNGRLQGSHNTSLCADVQGASDSQYLMGGGPNPATGMPLQSHPCNGALNQKWNLSGPIRYNANRNKCIDIPGASSESVTAVQLWDCNGWINQLWDYYWQ